jgi:hypothetical protein
MGILSAVSCLVFIGAFIKGAGGEFMAKLNEPI